MMFKDILLHYYNWKIGSVADSSWKQIDRGVKSKKYLKEIFKSRTKVEQACRLVVKRFINGNIVFPEDERADLMDKIDEIEPIVREQDRLIWDCRKSENSAPFIPEPKKIFFRHVLFHCFLMKKTYSESYWTLQDFYHRKEIPSEHDCFRFTQN